MNMLIRLKTSPQSLILPETDYYRLFSAIDYEKRKGKISRRRLNHIRKLLRNVNLYPIRLLPADVVTINSEFELVGQCRKVWRVKLVNSPDANNNQRQISVFSRLGMSLLGRQTGHTIIAQKLRIGKIMYQPEAFNHFHL